MQEVIIAGFGGQGVLAAGVVLATMGMKADLHTTWIPTYGAQQRGGTANCSVKISEHEVGSPYIDSPDILLVLNEPSLNEFEQIVKPGGYIFVNSSLVSKEVEKDDVTVVAVDATNLATELGNIRVANIIMLGALLGKVPIVPEEKAAEALAEHFKGKSQGIIDLNIKAIQKGIEVVSVQ